MRHRENAASFDSKYLQCNLKEGGGCKPDEQTRRQVGFLSSHCVLGGSGVALIKKKEAVGRTTASVL